jgi:hypothetical protein
MKYAWKAIIPKPFRSAAVRDAFQDAMDEVGRGIKEDYEETTRTWAHKVEFEADFKVTRQEASGTVSTDDEIYGYVENGTRPHIIAAVNAPSLAFQGLYTAKTMPGTLGARQGGKSGPMVYAQVVHHPGTEPRDFTKIIEKRWKPRIQDLMKAAMVRAAQASGHGK